MRADFDRSRLITKIPNLWSPRERKVLIVAHIVALALLTAEFIWFVIR